MTRRVYYPQKRFGTVQIQHELTQREQTKMPVTFLNDGADLRCMKFKRMRTVTLKRHLIELQLARGKCMKWSRNNVELLYIPCECHMRTSEIRFRSEQIVVENQEKNTSQSA